MKFSCASLLAFTASSVVIGVNGQFGGNNTAFEDSNSTSFESNSTNITDVQTSAQPAAPVQPVGAVVPPPTLAPITSSPTSSPTSEPTITPEPTDVPTPTPSVSNQDVCDDIDDDWEDWYQDITYADHTCSCQATVEGLAENRIRMQCIGEELYCCAATGICYETDDATEHIIADRLNDGLVDDAVWRSCTNVYTGGVANPIKSYRICHEFSYAPQTAVSRQEGSKSPLAGCRVSINDQECNSCTPCEQNGPHMTGYDCTNVEGVDQIPIETFPGGPQTECHGHDFPVCTFNGRFVDVDKSVLLANSGVSLSLRVSVAAILAGALLSWF